jgi:hypothetical protein
MTGMTVESVCPSQGFAGQRRHVGDELSGGSPGRSRADEAAPRFFAARRNGYPISCFIIRGRRPPKPTGRPRQSAARLPVGARSDRRLGLGSRVYSDKRGCDSSGACPNADHHDRAYDHRSPMSAPCRPPRQPCKSSRSQSEKMLLRLDIAERVNQGWRPHRCSAESRLDRYAP